MTVEILITSNDDEKSNISSGEVVTINDGDSPITEGVNSKKSKNLKRKLRKKAKQSSKLNSVNLPVKIEPKDPELPDVEIEYESEALTFLGLSDFSDVFQKYILVETPVDEVKTESGEKKTSLSEVPVKLRGFIDDDDDDDKDVKQEKQPPKISKRQLKKQIRLTAPELKQLVPRPDLVEMHDVTARNPKLLIFLKSIRNTVPVPRHWCAKRKYLQGKRGIEKHPYELPDCIRNTGVMEKRQILQEKENAKSLRSKMKEKVRPKMGKNDFDYQQLYDAFFKFQTKPEMTLLGDLYYEGKEFENQYKHKKPGVFSDFLRESLGMSEGYGAEKVPPPWLIAMQRYGPPPSYPHLKIPGLNAPIPDGCSFGYHPGGWGKPPVDENGKPLYGDIFVAIEDDYKLEEVDKRLWGEMVFDDDSEDEVENDEEEQDENDETGNDVTETTMESGLETPSGTASVASTCFETPESIELRKRKIEDAMDKGDEVPMLFHVLPEKKVNLGNALMGSSFVYDIGSAKNSVDICLEPDELDMDSEVIEAKMNQQLQREKHEDLSDMVAEHQASMNKKRKKNNADTKSKKFKF